MKNNNTKSRQKITALREKISKLIRDDEIENFKKYVKGGISETEICIIMEEIRNARLNDFFEDLNIDKEKLEKTKKQIIRLSPTSTEFPLLSTLYRDHDGNYKVEDLFFEYHDSILRDGIMVGMDYAKKFFVEDIQKNRFKKEDIMNMTSEEIEKYCEENREEI